MAERDEAFWLSGMGRSDDRIRRCVCGLADERGRNLDQRYSQIQAVTGSQGDNRGVEQLASVVERWLAAGDADLVDIFDDLLQPDVVVHAPLGLSSQGLQAEKQVWRDAVAAMPDLRHEVQEVVAQGNVEMARVIVTGTLHGDFAGVVGTGRSFRIDQAVICHLRDGKVAEAWEIADVASLIDQVSP